MQQYTNREDVSCGKISTSRWTFTQTSAQRSKLLNLLPNDKILDWSKLKEFQVMNVTKNIKFDFHRLEKIARKKTMLVTRVFFITHVFKRFTRGHHKLS